MSSETLEKLENDQHKIHRQLGLLLSGSEDLGSMRWKDSLQWNAQNPEGEALGMCPDKDQRRRIMSKVIPELPKHPDSRFLGLPSDILSPWA